MLGVLRFWLDRGVDGFRVDVIWHLIKDAEFRNNPPNPTWTPDGIPYHEFLPVYTSDRPEVHDVIAQMRRLFDEYHERVLIGEIYLPIERLVQYYGEDMSGAHLPFNFQLLLAPWDARHIGQLIEEYEAQLAGRGLAELGARQSRQPSHREPCRARAGADRRDDAAHAARNADAVLRRRNRHVRRGHPSRPRAGPVREERAGQGPGARSRAHADAVGCGAARRFYDGGALASDREGLEARERLRAARGTRLHSRALPAAHHATAWRTGARSRTVRVASGGTRRPRVFPPGARRRCELPRGPQPGFPTASAPGDTRDAWRVRHRRNAPRARRREDRRRCRARAARGHRAASCARRVISKHFGKRVPTESRG